MVIEDIKRAAGVDHAFIAARDTSGQFVLEDAPWESPFVCGYDGEHGIKAYLDYYRAFDDWERFEAGRRQNTPFLLSRLEGYTLPDQSEFWEWLNTLNITDNAYTKLFDLPGGWAGINLHFDQSKTDGQRVLDVLQLIQQPVGLTLRLQQSGWVSARPWADQLESTSFARLVLRADGRVCEIGQRAEALIRSEPNLYACNGKFAFSNSQVQQEFRARLDAAVATRLPQVHVVPEELFGRCFTLVINPLIQSRGTLVAPETLLLITLINDDDHAPMIQPFAQAHRFNETVTVVLEAVYQGKGARQIADELGLSHSYIRELLSKQVYPALGVSDMQELSALLGKIHRAAI